MGPLPWMRPAVVPQTEVSVPLLVVEAAELSVMGAPIYTLAGSALHLKLGVTCARTSGELSKTTRHRHTHRKPAGAIFRNLLTSACLPYSKSGALPPNQHGHTPPVGSEQNRSFLAVGKQDSASEVSFVIRANSTRFQRQPARLWVELGPLPGRFRSAAAFCLVRVFPLPVYF